MNGHTPSQPAAEPPATKTVAHKTVKEGFLARILDPLDRLIEGIYSVLIVLTFTLAARAIQVQSGELADASNVLLQLFVAALGCAVAWGLIDGAMYVLTCVFERGKDRRLYRLVRNASSEDEGIAVLSDELDDDVGSLATSAERRQIYAALYARLRTSPPPPGGFERADFAGGLGVFLVALGAALPVLLPLVLLPGSVEFRLRASNTVAFVMLFGMGYRWGQYAGGKPFRTGLMLLILGIAMMIVAIPLGG
jgi:hypothetical protein